MGYRHAQSRRGGKRGSSGFVANVLVPVGLVALGLGIVVGIGFALRNTPVGEFLGVADSPASQESEQASQPEPAPGQGAETAPQIGPDEAEPATKQPGEAKEDPDRAEQGDAAPKEPEPSASEGAGASEAAESEDESEDPAAAAMQQVPAFIDRAGGAADTMLITVYYTDRLGKGAVLRPVQVQIPRTPSRIYVTTEQLLNPPTDLGLYSSAPSGTQIRGVNANGGVAIVDLSSEMQEIEGSAAAENFMASLVYSLTEIPGINAVELRIEGWPADLDGSAWSGPLTRADVQAATGVEVAP